MNKRTALAEDLTIMMTVNEAAVAHALMLRLEMLTRVTNHKLASKAPRLSEQQSTLQVDSDVVLPTFVTMSF